MVGAYADIYAMANVVSSVVLILHINTVCLHVALLPLQWLVCPLPFPSLSVSSYACYPMAFYHCSVSSPPFSQTTPVRQYFSIVQNGSAALYMASMVGHVEVCSSATAEEHTDSSICKMACMYCPVHTCHALCRTV